MKRIIIIVCSLAVILVVSISFLTVVALEGKPQQALSPITSPEVPKIPDEYINKDILDFKSREDDYVIDSSTIEELYYANGLKDEDKATKARVLDGELNSQNNKEYIYDRMLNTIDHFTTKVNSIIKLSAITVCIMLTIILI